jgi:hypothetical protein
MDLSGVMGVCNAGEDRGRKGEGSGCGRTGGKGKCRRSSRVVWWLVVSL